MPRGIPNHGKKHPKQKLTAEIVLEIRRTWKARDGVTLQELAKKYGVGYQTIWRAAIGETWKHLKHL